MADINAVNGGLEDIATLTFTATNSGGDSLVITNRDADLLVIFKNDAAGSVTPTIANQVAASLTSAEYGLVQKADISEAIATTVIAAVRIPRKYLGSYLTAANKINLTYASHDVAFKVAAIQMA
jgi:hypothetical protein